MPASHRVLPHVSHQNCSLALSDWVDSVGGLGDGQLASLVSVQPCPARAELCGTSSLELGNEEDRSRDTKLRRQQTQVVTISTTATSVNQAQVDVSVCRTCQRAQAG